MSVNVSDWLFSESLFTTTVCGVSFNSYKLGACVSRTSYVPDNNSIVAFPFSSVVTLVVVLSSVFLIVNVAFWSGVPPSFTLFISILFFISS